SPKRDGWASTSVREMLRRDLYQGRIVYGKTRWQDKGGTKVKVDIPENEWLTLDAPELRIVPEDLWRAAHARLERTRRVYTGHRTPSGALHGSPEAGLISRHLLSGHLRCGVCGGNWSCPGLVEGELLSRSSRHHHRGGYRDSTPQVDRRS
ncbi:MAG: recombinase family protein, partial [Candidatus Limnocylindria bacterium]